MRHHRLLDEFRPTEELIAGFGEASIMRTLDGEYHIRGGTEQERAKAQDWTQHFLTNPPHTPPKPG